VFVCSETCPAGKASCGPDASRPCIRENLLCDGRNNCGNNNDEEYCGEFYTITVTDFHTHHYCYLTGVYIQCIYQHRRDYAIYRLSVPFSWVFRTRSDDSTK